MPLITKIVSGGQTGVDRAALDVALELGLPCGGWCPPGRGAEDEPIPQRYPLRETPVNASPETPEIPNSQRSAWNVCDSDGTLVLVAGPALPSRPRWRKWFSRLVALISTRGRPTGGTALTIALANKHGKPYLVLDLNRQPDPGAIREWCRTHQIRVLNVAGPRERESPGIYRQAAELLRGLLA